MRGPKGYSQIRVVTLLAAPAVYSPPERPRGRPGATSGHLLFFFSEKPTFRRDHFNATPIAGLRRTATRDVFSPNALLDPQLGQTADHARRRLHTIELSLVAPQVDGIVRRAQCTASFTYLCSRWVLRHHHRRRPEIIAALSTGEPQNTNRPQPSRVSVPPHVMGGVFSGSRHRIHQG